MRRFLTTLMILLVVLVAGLSALVMMVDPNDFRGYMIKQVEQRSGYQLKLNGPLRWHVWPQLSILSGRMSLTAPGASQPLVSADNMRLDVDLLPLISHRLQVSQVMLKGAVIQLTPQSEERRPADAPVAPGASRAPGDETRGWSFDIGRLEVNDSLLVFQHGDDEQVTVRGINLQMEQDEHHRGQLSFRGRINRDQRDLTLSIDADLDASDYPENLSANVTRLEYQLQGASLPQQGINGQGSFKALWQEPEKRLSMSDFSMTANDSMLRGTLSILLSERPVWKVDLTSDNLNLDALLVRASAAGTPVTSQQGQNRLRPRPVIASSGNVPQYSLLRSFSGEIDLHLASLRWRGLHFSDVTSHMVNNGGALNIDKLEGRLDNGTISLPGSVDARGDEALARFQPRVENVGVARLLAAFDYPLAVSGQLSMSGDFSGSELDAEAFRRSWQGKASIDMRNVRLQGMNFQQLVQQAVARENNDVSVKSEYETATVMSRFRSSAILEKGILTLEKMAGSSQVLALEGSGTLDLGKELCDALFNVRVIDGWDGNSALVETLKQMPVPLRIYGPWNQLNYKLQVDRELRNHLRDEAKQRLKEWAERNKESRKGQDLQKLLKDM
ncbi:outer membrane assembly protein AsmA [Erwinia sp. CPCC 100877]|nr:outer membrane assembly protein AsmA [Erwinia sp. CPCC 100877]